MLESTRSLDRFTVNVVAIGCTAASIIFGFEGVRRAALWLEGNQTNTIAVSPMRMKRRTRE